MASLKEAAQARAAAKTAPVDEMKMNHPTMDSPAAGQRVTYNPPPPQKRFDFLKRFASVPGLRAKGAAQAQQQV